MSVSVYLCNQIIQVAVGTRGSKGTLKKMYTSVAPEGCIINGIIMDSEVFGAFLKDFWEKNNIPKKDVYLIVKSNKIAAKNLEVPVLNTKKTFDFITREFSDMQREEDENTIAYTQLGLNKNSKLRKLYAEMAPKEQLREFLYIFEGMGITLKGIISAEGSVIGYLQSTFAKNKGTFISQIVNGNLVSNVLFVDGTFKYYNSVRCFHDVGSPEYLDDLARSLNHLEQFMSTQKISSPVEKIYVAGTQSDNLSQYSIVLSNQGVNASCEIMNLGLGDSNLNYEAQRALFAYSGLFSQGGESNFLANFNMRKDNSQNMDPAFKRRVVLIASVFIFMLVVLGVMLSIRLIAQSKYNEAYDYNNSSAVKLQVAEYEEAIERRDSMQKKYNSINTVVETIYSYPVCNDDIINIIEETAKGFADIEIISFDAEVGQVTFSAKSTEVEDIYKYIDKLLAEDVFMNVDHTGYTWDEREGIYDIHVQCTLCESAGRED